MKQEVYWQTTLGSPTAPGGPIPENVEVAVIGGGITGLSAALTLARRGTRTAVLEAQSVGWGASSRNGGMVLPGLKISLSAAIRRYGRELAGQLFRWSLDAVDTVEQLVTREGIDCGFHRSGHLLLANKPSHFEAMKEEVEFMAREFGYTLRLVPRAELVREIGSSIHFGGLVDEVSAGLNPAQFTAGLARVAEAAGAHLCTGAGVIRVERAGSRFRLHTRKTTVEAEAVIVATSGYTGRATPQLNRKIIRIGSFIIASAPMDDALAREISPNGRMYFDSRHFLNYFRVADGRMVFGGRAAFFPETGDTVGRSAEILRREMLGIFPQLADLEIEFAWGGDLDFTVDQMPHVGSTDGLAFSLGYAGHGVALATQLGRTLAEGMLAGTLDAHPFARIPFRGAPPGLYGGRPWLLPLAGLWYRILDLIE